MPVVSMVDYISKRIYLHSSTVGVDFDTMDVYKEVRALRFADTQAPYPHRNFKPMIIQGGNIQKTPTTKTAKYVQLLYGCRIVPFDTNQNLRVICDTFTDDGFAGRDCFDRSSLTNIVDIDIDFPEVEIRYVYVGGSSLTKEDIRTEMDTNSVKLIELQLKIDELHKIGGLDISNPATTTQDEIIVGDIKIDITGDGETTTTFTRV